MLKADCYCFLKCKLTIITPPYIVRLSHTSTDMQSRGEK